LVTTVIANVISDIGGVDLEISIYKEANLEHINSKVDTEKCEAPLRCISELH